MKISRKWLQQLLDLTGISDEDIASRLTMLGIEVESYENLSGKYDGFVVGAVLDVQKHPNADKLSLCSVDIGGDIKSIVCGAPNVAAGQKVPVGLIGSTVPHNQHDPEGKPFQLAKVKIRGVESEGMICSASELGLGEDKSGIMVFAEDAAIGTPLAVHLGLDDTVFEISLTPNRADCLSHVGIARELSAAFTRKLAPQRIRFHEDGASVNESAKVSVLAPELCPRYSARVIRGIKVGPSPKWLRDSVERVGMRSINNVVDATNYVMMEVGQPLHAFDLNLIAGHKIIVRRPLDKETKFTTLDGKERNISPEMVMICDKEKIVAIGGVMGGMNSEISEATTDVLIESANFAASSIRKTAKALGLSTEASYRFERGVDPNLTIHALDRVSEIITEAAGGKLAPGIIDVAVTKFLNKRIELHVDHTNRLLGTRLASGEIKRVLDSIEIHCDKKSETVLICSVPTFRGDIEREVDIIEEVGRVYGYENIADSFQTKLSFDIRFRDTSSADELREFLAGAGFNEITTNSLQPAALAGFHDVPYVALANPISEDMAAMRTTLLPGALECVRLNLSHGLKNIKFFEIGRVYGVSDERQIVGNFVESERISIVLSGTADPSSYDRKEAVFDIFDLKSEIERLLRYLNLDSWDFISYDTTKQYEHSLKLSVNGMELGLAGRVSEAALGKFSVEQDVYFAELDLAGLLKLRKDVRKFRGLPKFPFASFDLSFIVDQKTPAAGMMKSLRSAAGEIFRDISVFDIYSGEGIPEGKKSIAFTVALGSEERTLNDGDIAGFIAKAEMKLSEEFSAELRKQKS
jgi:phenylalanyl-tRNA synthetase beta chain